MSVNLIFLSGSSRKQSLNKKLAQLACKMAADAGANATYIDLADYPMPIYNGDLEDAEGMPEKARELKKIFIGCDGFFIASPEYNSSISALLKNTLDWMSREDKKGGVNESPYKGKVAAISAASPGALGGLRGLVPLRMILVHLGVHVIPSQVAVSKAHEIFDGNGNLINESNAKMLENQIREFIATSASLKNALR